jgi:hypothetical protein
LESVVVCDLFVVKNLSVRSTFAQSQLLSAAGDNHFYKFKHKMRTLFYGAALVLASIAGLAQSQAMINGFVVTGGNDGISRYQSNANHAVNGVYTKQMVQVDQDDGQITFITSSLNKTNGKMFDQNVIQIAASPVPKVLIRKTATAYLQGAFAFDQASQGIAFPMAFQYTETNGVPGFQAGADVITQNITLASKSDWGMLTTSTETAPMMLVPTQVNVTTTVNVTTVQNTTMGLMNVTMPVNITTTQTVLVPTGTAIVTVVKTTNGANGFTFTYRFSNTTFVRNNVTYLADAVKVDIMANTTNFKANSNLAIMATVLTTTDMLTLAEYHNQVDAAMAQAAATKGVAVVSPDFVAQFNSNNSNSAYVNFARKATVIKAGAANSTTAVMAQLITNAQTAALLKTMDSVMNNEFAGGYGSIDNNFNFMTNQQYVLFSFLNTTNGANAINWDPEVGVANVQTTQTVIAGPGAANTASTTSTTNKAALGSGAIAGIVIAAIALAGIAGFVVYRKIKAKSTGEGYLLDGGNEMSRNA